jgi:hypothetical protein
MKDPYDDRQIKADCGHYVADHNELVEDREQTWCPDCYAYRDEIQD